MRKVTWRAEFAWGAIKSKLSGGAADLGVVLFFITPGALRNSIFGPTFVARRFLRKFGVGDCVRRGSEVELTVADLTFAIPVRGFEQGDVFDIALPYAVAKDPPLGERVAAYLEANTNRFYDGPYLTEKTPLRVGDVAVDAGASVGLFTVTASRLVGPSGRVLAFEPIAEARDLLEKNVRRNGCGNVDIVPAALGEETRVVTLDVNLGAHFEGSSKYIRRGGTSRQVEQRSLDEYAGQHGIGKISFLKADIEGSERDLLTGAIRTLATHHPHLAIRTYHLPDDPEILAGIVERVGGYSYEVERGTTLHAWGA